MSTVFPQLLSIKLNETGYLLNTILRQIPACVLELFKEQRHAEGTCNYDPSTFLLILENSDVESNLILLETLSSNKEFLNEIYTRLSVEKQLSYIKFLSSAMQHGHHKDIHLEFFANEFKLKSDIILKSDLQRLELEFLNIAALLELLSGASAKHEQLEQFQKDCSLVTTTMHLLQLTHQSSLFIPIEKLSKIQEEHKDHPGFLFKANLIRLLGNLTHKHRQNQDMIGESCLELILNCTKIDALNPFITQWSIWAIQNLLDGNQQNQSIVSNLTLTSTAYSETLEEFGLRTVIKDNVIRLERKPS